MDGWIPLGEKKSSKDRSCSENVTFFAWERREEEQTQWSLMQTSSSCDGIRCVLLGLQRLILEPREGSRGTGWTETLLAHLILIYEFLFPRTYSIFISYIYLFWEYIFAVMRLKNKKGKYGVQVMLVFSLIYCVVTARSSEICHGRGFPLKAKLQLRMRQNW